MEIKKTKIDSISSHEKEETIDYKTTEISNSKKFLDLVKYNYTLNDKKWLRDEIINQKEYIIYYQLLSKIFLPLKEITQIDNIYKVSLQELENFVINKLNYTFENFEELYSKEFFEKLYNHIENITKEFCPYVIEHLLISIFTQYIEIDMAHSLNYYIYDNQVKIRKLKYISNIKQVFIENSYITNQSNINEKNDSVFNKKLFDLLDSSLHYIDPNDKSKKEYQFNDDCKNNLYQEQFYKDDALLYLIYMIQKKKFNNFMTFIEILKIPKSNNKIKEYFDIINEKFLKYPGYILEEFIVQLFVSNRMLTNPKRYLCVNYPDKTYDITLALIDNKYSLSTLSPISSNPYIDSLILNKNIIGELGMFEVGYQIILNENIKELEFNQMKFNQYSLISFCLGTGLNLFSNIESLSLANNSIEKDCNYFLALLIKKLPNLKSLNLIKNRLGSSAAFLFNQIIQNYKENKTSLEKIYLNQTELDPNSLYQLGVLLSMPNCNIKLLSLCQNDLDNWGGKKLLKEISYNSTIEEIYLNRCNINNSHLKYIKNIIITSGINWIYLHHNLLNNFQILLRILYFTVVRGFNYHVFKEKENMEILLKNNIDLNSFNINNECYDNIQYNSTSVTSQIDISDNTPFAISDEELNLMVDIFQNTSLSMVDFLGNLKRRKENDNSKIKQIENINGDTKEKILEKMEIITEIIVNKVKLLY